ncbi:hypothetical protein Forpe1208_v009539 [Fusarium oxysporum f. sp. rapae]|uniref:Uncharacterized protein n=1 Tax=Fusarium oxysporum f. sp. rapae TaxID=485398 RepID=A0A8J5TVY7_FUSOX|nr:hypothetical protein Forpe1208_v009539 [Fusarium oxysporum f. sp. rapae]
MKCTILILCLSMSNSPRVVADNIRQTFITKAFVPAACRELEIPGGNMIIYAMLLRPEKHLGIHFAKFVDGFDWPRTFNQ